MRPVFKFNNNEIKAAGILFYRISKKKRKLQFLMIKDNNNTYSDFGGKTDKCDKNMKETALRETLEESNHIFNKKVIEDQMVNDNPICNIKSKYALYFYELIKVQFKCNDFGSYELHDNIKRTVKWVSYGTLMKMSRENKLNFRLKFKSFFDKIKYLNRNLMTVL
jgi:hypothetical protein